MRSQWKDASERMMAENAAQKEERRGEKINEHVKQANKVVSEETKKEEEEKQNANKGTEKKGPEIGLLKFSYDGELTGEIDGPTVTASATTDNSWDFSMTLDRNLESSQDPGIPVVLAMLF